MRQKQGKWQPNGIKINHWRERERTLYEEQKWKLDESLFLSLNTLARCTRKRTGCRSAETINAKYACVAICCFNMNIAFRIRQHQPHSPARFGGPSQADRIFSWIWQKNQPIRRRIQQRWRCIKIIVIVLTNFGFNHTKAKRNSNRSSLSCFALVQKIQKKQKGREITIDYKFSQDSESNQNYELNYAETKKRKKEKNKIKLHSKIF